MSKILDFCLAQVGKPYVFGRSGPSSFDCSGLTKRAVAQIGLEEGKRMSNEEKKFCVYKHILPNGKSYIGLTCKKPEHRWGKGGSGYKGNVLFWRAIIKYGWDNISHEIVSKGVSKEEAIRIERDEIIKNGTKDPFRGYNLTDGGEGTRGFFPSEETRQKLSIARIGNKNALNSKSRTGYKNSEESKEKNRVASMGNKNAIGNKSRKGQRNSNEHNQKIARANIGKKRLNTEEWSTCKPVVKLLDGTFVAWYPSVSAANRALGVKFSHISDCCRGKRKTYYGFAWEYSDKSFLKELL